MKNERLTTKQTEVLNVIQKYQRIKRPTVREVARRLNKSVSTIQQHIRRLEEKGYL